uniref:Uncharacterized protein n=1 Tax=Caenorhabditis japonica TaxID=281687 RepID=A0A8R1I9H9_CAEJA
MHLHWKHASNSMAASVFQWLLAVFNGYATCLLQKKEKNGELIFDDLDAKTRALKLDSKTEQSDLMDGKAPKRKSIKKADQKASTMSLNISKIGGKESTSSQRSNSLESPGINVAKGAKVGLSMFEAATMMCNIVDITTDSTTKSAKNDKAKMVEIKREQDVFGRMRERRRGVNEQRFMTVPPPAVSTTNLNTCGAI